MCVQRLRQFIRNRETCPDRCMRKTISVAVRCRQRIVRLIFGQHVTIQVPMKIHGSAYSFTRATWIIGMLFRIDCKPIPVGVMGSDCASGSVLVHNFVQRGAVGPTWPESVLVLLVNVHYFIPTYPSSQADRGHENDHEVKCMCILRGPPSHKNKGDEIYIQMKRNHRRMRDRVFAPPRVCCFAYPK